MCFLLFPGKALLLGKLDNYSLIPNLVSCLEKDLSWFRREGSAQTHISIDRCMRVDIIIPVTSLQLLFSPGSPSCDGWPMRGLPAHPPSPPITKHPTPFSMVLAAAKFRFIYMANLWGIRYSDTAMLLESKGKVNGNFLLSLYGKNLVKCKWSN